MKGTREPPARCHKNKLSSILAPSWRCHPPAQGHDQPFLRSSVMQGIWQINREPGEESTPPPVKPLLLPCAPHSPPPRRNRLRKGFEAEPTWIWISALLFTLSVTPGKSFTFSKLQLFLGWWHGRKDRRAPKPVKVGFISISPPGYLKSSNRNRVPKDHHLQGWQKWRQVGT